MPFSRINKWPAFLYCMNNQQAAQTQSYPTKWAAQPAQAEWSPSYFKTFCIVLFMKTCIYPIKTTCGWPGLTQLNTNHGFTEPFVQHLSDYTNRTILSFVLRDYIWLFTEPINSLTTSLYFYPTGRRAACLYTKKKKIASLSWFHCGHKLYKFRQCVSWIPSQN